MFILICFSCLILNIFNLVSSFIIFMCLLILLHIDWQKIENVKYLNDLYGFDIYHTWFIQNHPQMATSSAHSVHHRPHFSFNRRPAPRKLCAVGVVRMFWCTSLLRSAIIVMYTFVRYAALHFAPLTGEISQRFVPPHVLKRMHTLRVWAQSVRTISWGSRSMVTPVAIRMIWGLQRQT